MVGQSYKKINACSPKQTTDPNTHAHTHPLCVKNTKSPELRPQLNLRDRKKMEHDSYHPQGGPYCLSLTTHLPPTLEKLPIL